MSNVFGFGAVGDGIADDTQALQHTLESGDGVLRLMPSSWDELVAATESHDQAVNVVHGALPHYDLADLIEMVGKSKVRESDSANPLGPLAKSAE